MYVDLYAVASLAELAVRLERAWARVRPRWRRVADRVLDAARLGLSRSGAGVAVQFQQQPATDPLPALHALLDLPTQLGEVDHRVVLILDEFQSVAAVPSAEGVMRSHLQHHRRVAGYVFAGSEPHLLERQFDDPDRPFYGQALRLRLGRPAREDLAAAVDRGFQMTERSPGQALGPLLDLAEEHPQRTMLLAHFLWEATGEGQIAGLEEWELARATAMDQAAGEVLARFESLSPNQRRVLRAVAATGTPFARATTDALGLERGSIGSSVESLVRAGHLERRPGANPPTRGSYRLIDPLLTVWLRDRFGAAPPGHGDAVVPRDR